MRGSFLLLILLGYFQVTLLGQHLSMPGFLYEIDYKKHPGKMVLKNGQTIYGIFQYTDIGFPSNYFKSFDESGALVAKYKVTDVSSLTLAGADTSLSTKDSTYFVKIGKSTLYRQLTFGSILIYDPLINVNERSGLVYADLLVIENSHHQNILTDHQLLRLMEKKLKQSKVVRSFKTVQELIRYLNMATF
jgi:hypothetical protein